MLKREPVGSFVVRQSSQPGCFALSVRVPQNLNNNSSDVSHYLILHTANGGYKLKVKIITMLSTDPAKPYLLAGHTRPLYMNF